MTSFDISAAENLMRVGVNEDSELNSLLAYYRNKIDDFSKQRLEWLTKFDECKHDVELRHKLEWENRRLKDRVEELEKALSHHKTALYDQRQNYLKLLRENNELKLKQTVDTRRIQDLVNVCEPFEDQMVMCKDIRPEISNKFIVNDLNIHKYGVNLGLDKAKNPAGGQGSRQNVGLAGQKTAKSTSKSTSVPSDLQTTHELEMINLKKSHELEAQNLSEQVNTLKDELDRLQSRYDERQDIQTQQYKNLLTRHTDIEKKHNNLAQEYFNVRMKLTQDQQRNQEKAELLRVKNIYLTEKMKEQEKRSERQHKAIEELVHKRNNDFKAKYKADMRRKEEHLSILKEQYEKVQEIYLNKIKALEDHLSKLNDKYNDLTKKSKRQAENLRSQLKVMEQRVEKEQLEKVRLEMQQLQEEQKKKQEEQDKEELKRLEQAEERKQRKAQEIKKAYESMDKTKTSHGKTKKTSSAANRAQEKEIEEEQEEESMNSSDIENIKKHIRELETKLELDRNK